MAREEILVIIGVIYSLFLYFLYRQIKNKIQAPLEFYKNDDVIALSSIKSRLELSEGEYEGKVSLISFVIFYLCIITIAVCSSMIIREYISRNDNSIFLYSLCIILYSYMIISQQLNDIFYAPERVSIEKEGISIDFLFRKSIYIEYKRIRDILPGGPLGIESIRIILSNTSVKEISLSSGFIQLPKDLMNPNADAKLVKLNKKETV